MELERLTPALAAHRPQADRLPALRLLAGGFLFLVVLSAALLISDNSSLAGSANQFGGSAKWHDYFCIGQEVCDTGDFNDDGRDDAIIFVRGAVANPQYGDVYVSLSTGSAFSTTVGTWHGQFCTGNETCGVGDFNGDGRDDIVSFGSATGEFNVTKVALSTGSSFGAATQWQSQFCISTSHVCKVGDVNNDGRDDAIQFVRGSSGASQGDVYVALSNGSSFGTPSKWHEFFCINQEICDVGDFTGDGRDDIVTFTLSVSGNGSQAVPQGFFNSVWVAASSGSAFGTSSVWHDSLCTNRVCRVGDFDGDGREDIAEFVCNTQGGATASDVNVSLSNGSTAFGAASKWHDFFCIGAEVLRTGDVNNDGSSDLVAFVRDSQGTGATRGDVWVASSQAVPTGAPTTPATMTIPPGTTPAVTVPPVTTPPASGTTGPTTPAATTPGTSPTPTVTPTEGPSGTPTSAPPPTPAPTPDVHISQDLVGDVNLDRQIGAADVIGIIRHHADLDACGSASDPGLSSAGAVRPRGGVDQPEFQCAFGLPLGDLDSNGLIDLFDGLNLLRDLNDLPCDIGFRCIDLGHVRIRPAGSGLRVLTYNLQFLNPLAFNAISELNPNPYAPIGLYEERAHLIAARIKAGDYDIVALQEVFWDRFDKPNIGGETVRAREVIMAELQAEYPYFIAQLGGEEQTHDDVEEDRDCSDEINAAEFLDDSGDMLFSRYPFAELRKHDAVVDQFYASYPGVEAMNGPLGEWSEEIGWRIYDSYSGSDCGAMKGAALARIETPVGMMNLAVTHMNASPGTEGAVHISQLGEIEDLIQGTVPLPLEPNEHLMVVGDTNMNAYEATDNANMADGSLNLFTEVLGDAWTDYMPETDSGLTSPTGFGSYSTDNGFDYSTRHQDPYQRIDRMFLKFGPPVSEFVEGDPWCVQQMIIAYDLRYGEPYEDMAWGPGGRVDLSDHLPVAADINHYAPYCNPKAAKPLRGSLGSGMEPGEIQYPGGMYWYHFTGDPGTYSLALTTLSGRVECTFDTTDARCPKFQVFDETNLSVPVANWMGETTEDVLHTFGSTGLEPITGVKFVPRTGRFYVRVFFENQNSTGLFQLIWARHQCNSIDEACELSAAENFEFHVPENLPGAHEGWFTGYLRRPSAAVDQRVVMNVEWNSEISGLNDMEIELLESGGAEPFDAGAAPVKRCLAGSCSWQIQFDHSGGKRFMIKVTRRNFNVPFGEYTVGWDTDLTVIHSGELPYVNWRVVTELNTDDCPLFCVNPDNIEDVTITADGEQVARRFYRDDPDGERLFYPGNAFVFEDEFRAGRDAYPLVDDGLNFAFTQSLEIEFHQSCCEDERIYFRIAPLNLGESERIVSTGYATITEGGDGSYRMSYNLSKSIPQPGTSSNTAGHEPIVFIHGQSSDGGTWDDMIPWFEADGWRSSDLVAPDFSNDVSNAVVAQEVQSQVNQIRAATGADKVDIVTHSMGSLSGRYYLKALGGTAFVDAWVSLGGPNHGTEVANAVWCVLLPNPPCGEMYPDSTILNELNTGDETPGAVRYGTWWSGCDIVIDPDETVVLNGALNTETACIDHWSLKTDYGIYEQVRDFVRG